MKQMMIGIVAAITFSSCTQVAGWFGTNEDSTQTNIDSSSYAAFARDESITAENAYSDLFLDSSVINRFVEEEKLPDSVARRLQNFYLVRNYQYAWFASDGPTEQARGLWSLYTSEDEDSASNEPAAKLKERMDTILQRDSAGISKTDSSMMQTELALTHQFILYASEHPEHINSNNLYYLVPAKKQDPMQLADSLLNKQKDSAQHAGNKNYSLLKNQLTVYYNIAKSGGWGTIPASKELKKGSASPVAAAIKKRLQATKEYSSTDTSNVFNDSLITAIRLFQQRNGLAPTGLLNDSLISVLNVPVEERIEQILVNMNRLLWMPAQTETDRIQVNIPSQMLYAYSDSGSVLEMPVIVGKDGNSTIMFSSGINQVVFNPTWNIPESIVRNEILPKIKADASYLKKQNIEVVKQNDSLPVLRQLPGKDNPLGKVKFLFPNSHDIYLHDTPDKTAFAKTDRTLSHGCIRVADAGKLAQYLLQDEKSWDVQKITTAMNSGKEQTVTLKNEHPVSITYLTAWVDGKGFLNFRNDVYGHDKEAREKMFARKS